MRILYGSATGQRDGREWTYLSDSEKEMYRQRYLDFHSGRKGIEKVPEPEPEYDFEIPDLEFAYAWEKSYAGITDGRKWSELDERTEKSSFRKKYLAYKRQFIIGKALLACRKSLLMENQCWPPQAASSFSPEKERIYSNSTKSGFGVYHHHLIPEGFANFEIKGHGLRMHCG